MLYLHGVGHFHPENIIDNQFLENLDIGTTHEWILERVGIESRRTVLPLDYLKETKNADVAMAREASLYTNAQTGALASRMAVEKAGLKLSDIGMVISGSCTPQYSCPAEACTIAGELELEVPAMDINSACSSMAAQLNFLNTMQPDALPEYILVVNPENSTRSIDYSDRSSAVLWGDCTSAMVVSTKTPSKIKVLHSFLTSSPKGWEKVTFRTGSHFKQDGRTVQTFAIKRSLAIIKKMREIIEGERENNVKFIGHQANLLMLNSVCRMAEIDSKNHFFNVDKFGNCGAAGAPSVLSQNIDSLVAGDLVIMGVVGAGLSWGGVLLEVAK
ncbi:3-oxoacyl-ACP synthase [Halobacteriovorax marinus]|uniref:3-oxoacyl-ACP synthase n=1 Tax=Halobacteriovorax marinus TaxID=97084 RepID=A0A1Y5FA58_9BACT|nr:3-oxoacyl-ACP synthase [Halobacteriovorax marinus]